MAHPFFNLDGFLSINPKIQHKSHFFCDNNFIKILGLFDSFFYIS